MPRKLGISMLISARKNDVAISRHSRVDNPVIVPLTSLALLPCEAQRTVALDLSLVDVASGSVLTPVLALAQLVGLAVLAHEGRLARALEAAEAIRVDCARALVLALFAAARGSVAILDLPAFPAGSGGQRMPNAVDLEIAHATLVLVVPGVNFRR